MLGKFIYHESYQLKRSCEEKSSYSAEALSELHDNAEIWMGGGGGGGGGGYRLKFRHFVGSRLKIFDLCRLSVNLS